MGGLDGFKGPIFPSSQSFPTKFSWTFETDIPWLLQATKKKKRLFKRKKKRVHHHPTLYEPFTKVGGFRKENLTQQWYSRCLAIIDKGEKCKNLHKTQLVLFPHRCKNPDILGFLLTQKKRSSKESPPGKNPSIWANYYNF